MQPKECHMTTKELLSEWFSRIDDAMADLPTHLLAHLWPSKLVTLGVLFVLTGGGPPFRGRVLAVRCSSGMKK